MGLRGVGGGGRGGRKIGDYMVFKGNRPGNRPGEQTGDRPSL